MCVYPSVLYWGGKSLCSMLCCMDMNPTHPSPSWVATVHNWVQGKKISILRFIATSEIFLMVVVVFNIFR